MHGWFATLGAAEVAFADERAFRNVNEPADTAPSDPRR
jgi:hypothetical protein